MTGCPFCGVGSDDECTMDCPSRDRADLHHSAVIDRVVLDNIARILQAWMAGNGPDDEILADIAAQVIATGRRV